MKKLLVCLILITFFIACKKEKVLPPLKLDEINGTRLWERISIETDYTDYSYWPDHEEIKPGQAPHGSYHKIFINNQLLDSLPLENRIAPEGSIIVKENMNIDKKFVKMTVMAKIKGFNPEGGDWFWAAFSPDGEVLAEGVPAGCFNCHTGMKDNDYVIVRPLDYPFE